MRTRTVQDACLQVIVITVLVPSALITLFGSLWVLPEGWKALVLSLGTMLAIDWIILRTGIFPWAPTSAIFFITLIEGVAQFGVMGTFVGLSMIADGSLTAGFIVTILSFSLSAWLTRKIARNLRAG